MSEAITKAQPSAEFNGDWLLREVRFNAQGAVVDWRLPAQSAPSPQAPGRRKEPPGITLEPQSHEQPAVPVVSDEQIRKTVESIQDPDTVPAFHNGYYTLTPDELRRVILALRPAVEPMTDERLGAAVEAWFDDSPDACTTFKARMAAAIAAFNGITANAEGAHQPTKEAEKL